MDTAVKEQKVENTKKRKPLKMSYEKTGFQIFIVIYVTICIIFSMLSTYIVIISSMKTHEEIASNIFAFPDVAKIFSSIAENLSVAWSGIGVYFIRSVGISLVGAVGTSLTGAVLAYIIAFKNFLFKEWVFMLFIAVILVPSIIGYPILTPFVSQTLNLKDTYLGFILPQIGGGQVTAMFLFRTFYSQQPTSLYESAKVEGANDFYIFFKITLPLSKAIILYHMVGCFSGIYNNFLWASLILDDKLTLMPKMLSLSNTTFANQHGAMYAMYLISSIPLVFTTIISMKYFSSGDFASGMKL